MSARAQICSCPDLAEINYNPFTTAGGVHYIGALVVSAPIVPGSICSPTSVSFNGSAAADSSCSGDASSVSCANFNFSLFAPGTAITAIVTCTGWQCDTNGNCTRYSATSPPASFVYDSTAPTVTMTQAPTSGALISALNPITLGGEITSISPSTVTFDTSGQNRPSNLFYFSTGTTAHWEITIDTLTLTALGSGTTALTTLGVYARDIVGLVVSYSSNAASTTDPSLATQVNIDALPPVVSYDLAASTPGEHVISTGPLTSVPHISGIVTDDYGLGSMSITIEDRTNNTFWVPSSTAFVSGPATPISIQIDSGRGVLSSKWTYNGISDQNMTPGHSYAIAAVATDFVNNVSTTQLSFSLVNEVVQSTLVSLPLNLLGAVIFSPSNLAVQWGGYDAETIAVSISGTAAALLSLIDPNWMNSIVVQNDDGNLVLSQNTLGNIGVKSQKNSCQTSGQINVYYKNSIIGWASVTIQTPTSSVATKLRANVTQHTLKPDALPPECALPQTAQNALFCRADLWNVFILGETPQFLSKTYFFEQQSLGHPIDSTIRMCPSLPPINQPNFLPVANDSLLDTMGYGVNYSAAAAFRNCGEASTQDIMFASFYNPVPNDFNAAGPEALNNPYAVCTFIRNIQKTERLGFAPLVPIATTRSDSQ